MNKFLAIALLATFAIALTEAKKDEKFLFRPRPWIPLNIPVPGPAPVGGAPVTGGTCPGGSPQGCLTGQCNVAPDDVTKCKTDAAARGFCYDPTLAYPVGCPIDPLCERACK